MQNLIFQKSQYVAWLVLMHSSSENTFQAKSQVVEI